MVFGRQRRTFSRTTLVDASAEQVWDVLRDCDAMYWITTGCVLALPVPDRPEGVGALWCCWQQQRNGSLGALVHEVVDHEPGRLIALSERQRQQADSRLEFAIEPCGHQTRVQISLAESMYRYEWGMRGTGVTEQYLSRLAEGLELALVDEVPGPRDVQTLVLRSEAINSRAEHEIEVEGSPEDIWRLALDEAGTLLPNSSLEKQWSVEHGGRAVRVKLLRRPDGAMTCVFQEILCPETFRVIERGVAIECDQQLLPRQNGAVVRTTYRWDARVIHSQVIEESSRQWLAALKAAAEGDAA
jgi:uncharacterized protein YndB with AHSA1/START domain